MDVWSSSWLKRNHAAWLGNNEMQIYKWGIVLLFSTDVLWIKRFGFQLVSILASANGGAREKCWGASAVKGPTVSGVKEFQWTKAIALAEKTK